MSALLAEFRDPQALLAATRRARDSQYRILDVFTPYPVSGLGEAMGPAGRAAGQRINWLGFAGMVAGALFGWFIQWYANIDYPVNIGGRPSLAPPSFTVLTFEFAVLGGSLFMFFGMLILDRLPRLHHPVFDAPRFYLASRDRYFLLVDAPDEAARRFVEDLKPVSVAEVAE